MGQSLPHELMVLCSIVMLDIKEMTVSLTQVTGEIEADVSRLLERISTRELGTNHRRYFPHSADMFR